MELLGLIIFGLSLLGLGHSYLFFPWLLKHLSRGKVNNTLVYQQEEELPKVSVLMAVYNEEKVILRKISSLLQLNYPQEKLFFFIGSDASDDDTDKLISKKIADDDRFAFFAFRQRQGKPGVINRLAAKAFERRSPADDHILLMTDANVLLTPNTLVELVKHYRNDRIAIVDAHMVPTGLRVEGISRAEGHYINSEVLLKHREGIVWGKMMGPFGGCYTIRSTLFSPVPPNFLVDDFYIAMRAFERGGDAINELDAICHEAVSHEISEEYRRKSRISAGNFQNLVTFRKLWWPPLNALGFAFFSHKILRWVGPFLLIGLLAGSWLLAWQGNIFYRILFVLLTGGSTLLLIVDFFLRSRDIHWFPIRGFRYFLMMNLALLEGFFKYLKGIKSNVWQPPKRY